MSGRKVDFNYEEIHTYNNNKTPNNFASESNERKAGLNLIRQLRKYGYTNANYGSSNIVTQVALREEAEERALERGVAPLIRQKGSRGLVPRGPQIISHKQQKIINNKPKMAWTHPNVSNNRIMFKPQPVRKTAAVKPAAPAARKTRRRNRYYN